MTKGRRQKPRPQRAGGHFCAFQAAFLSARTVFFKGLAFHDRLRPMD